jgi:hypothetical protein
MKTPLTMISGLASCIGFLEATIVIIVPPTPSLICWIASWEDSAEEWEFRGL